MCCRKKLVLSIKLFVFLCRISSVDHWRWTQHWLKFDGKLLYQHEMTQPSPVMQFQWWWYLAHFEPMWNDMNNWETAFIHSFCISLTLNELFINWTHLLSTDGAVTPSAAAPLRCSRDVLAEGKMSHDCGKVLPVAQTLTCWKWWDIFGISFVWTTVEKFNIWHQ